MRLETRSPVVTDPPYDIVPIDQVDVEDIVAALGTAFGPRTPDWYRWKHLENPAGPSVGWAAVDGNGVVGVRLLQRWDLVVAGRKHSALRPVDTVTVPWAQRRGIFGALLEQALAFIEKRGETSVIFNTPNENSRGGYAKNGWTLLDPIRHGVRPTVPGPRLGAPIDPEALQFPSEAAPTIATDRTPAYVGWRYDRRSGHEYRAAAVRGDDPPAGIIYRIAVRRRLRTLILCEHFGPTATVSPLTAATALRERALATVAAVGQGTGSPAPFLRHAVRGSTVLAVRPVTDLEPDPLALNSWSLTLGDLEDVI